MSIGFENKNGKFVEYPTNVENLVQSYTTQEARQKIYPLGMLEAEDVADTIIFLLSDMSKKITGQSIWLSAGNDGGSIDGHIL